MALKMVWQMMMAVIKWTEALKEGKEVKVDIQPLYSSGSKRPETFQAKYWVDGKKKTAFFENKPGG